METLYRNSSGLQSCDIDTDTCTRSRWMFDLSQVEQCFSYVIHHPSSILVTLVPIQAINHLLFTSKKKSTFVVPDQFRFVALKITLTVILAILTNKDFDSAFFTNVIEFLQFRSPQELFFFSANNQMVSYVFIILISLFEMSSSLTMTLPMFLFWCVTFVSLSMQVCQKINILSYPVTLGSDTVQILWPDFVALTIVLFQCLLLCVGVKRKVFEKKEIDQEEKVDGWVHPQEESSRFGDFTLHWTTGFVKIASRRTLRESDVYDLVEKDRCHFAAAKFERNFKIEEARKRSDNNESKYKENDSKDNEKNESGTSNTNIKETTDGSLPPEAKKVSVVKVLAQTVGLRFALFQCMEAVAELYEFVTPILMGAFMNHMQNRDKEHWSRGLVYVLGIFVVNGFIHIFHRRLWSATCRILKQARGSVTILVFKKALTIRNESTKHLTTGEIVSLVSDDIDKVYSASQELFRVISTPVTILVSIYLLCTLIGNALFIGLAIMIALIPLNRYIAKSVEKLYSERDKTKRKRTKLMNEILNGIKLLKLYAWEPAFMQKVGRVRGEEERSNNKIGLVSACLEGMFRAVPFLMKVSAFGMFISFGGTLDAATGFVTLHLFHIISDPVLSLGVLITEFIQARVSLKRIEDFLNGDDIPPDTVLKKSDTNSAISMKCGEFTWGRNEETRSTLRNITVDIPKGSLIAVVGAIGSGKSSFLSAVLGEMEKLKGAVEIDGTLAYVPQEPWILNATLRDNVLFGSPLEQARYEAVITACALNTDIECLSAGDKTEIGEKGINLSGGQKQRVSMARALYNQADVCLFDDPLSAVDAAVGKHLFHEVLGPEGFLRKKTRVMVTHGLHWLPYADSIIVIQDGEISKIGTYDELVAHDKAFIQLLTEIQTTDSQKMKGETDGGTHNDINMDNVDSGNATISVIQPALDDSENDNRDILDSDSSDGNSDSDDDDNGDDDSSTKLSDRDSMDDETNDERGVLIKDEDLKEGKIKTEVYVTYLKALGYKRILFFCFLFLLTSFFDSYNNYVVQEWTDDPSLRSNAATSSDKRNELNWNYFSWFVLAGAVEVVGAFLYVLIVLRGTFSASTLLHNNLLYGILRCPMSFFDTTPMSRIFTRFSKDVSRVDGIGGNFQEFVTMCFDLLVFLAMIVIHCPTVGYYLIGLSVALYFLYKSHMGSVRQLKRFMSIRRPPIYSHFTESLNGVASIRAYNCQSRFVTKMESLVDKFTKVELMKMWCELALQLRSGLLYHLMSLIAGLICLFDPAMTAGMAGLILLYTEDVSRSMDDFCWSLANMEMEFVSLEKVIEYSNKPPEPKWEIKDKKPSSDWPTEGSILFTDFTAKYRKELDLVLKGIDCRIRPGEKVGIVGRTGAGKTSLVMSLFRIFESTNGKCVVDGVDIAEIGLHHLRSRINILPQDPVVFSGSIKMNLDPFGKFSDATLWNALRLSHLASFVTNLPGKLDFDCGGGGKNLSAGQRQLVCLARALLRKTKVLVLDEATAAVDLETDELIQKTIRTEFKDCTVLAVAHRINTIMDYDQIIVMDNGVIVEYNTPHNLLADRNSVFHGLARDAGLV